MELAFLKDRNRLEELEEVINRNLQSFYEVGRALMEIRDNELYKLKNGGSYSTFDAYCKSQWSMSKVHAYRFIDSVNVIDNLKSNQLVTPSAESQTRPLARLEPEQQKEVWQRAVETAPDGRVTARHVESIVREVRPKRTPIIKQDVISDSFQSAFDNMVDELKNASALKWKETSYDGALNLMRTLVTIIEQMGR